MRVLTNWFCRAWEGRLINIHPSLLPKYKGLLTIGALRAGDTVRRRPLSIGLSDEVDGGSVIDQKTV